MEKKIKTQIEKLVAEMAEKHDYLQALESTKNSARKLSDCCLKSKLECTPHDYKIVPSCFLWNLASLELNLLFLHKTFLDGCDEEFEKELLKIVKRVAFEEQINLEG